MQPSSVENMNLFKMRTQHKCVFTLRSCLAFGQVASAWYPDKIFIYFSLPRSWPGAYDYCAGLGLSLSTIATATEFTIVNTSVVSPKYWIGLNDRTTEGTFAWAGANGVYTSWATGNPATPNAANANNDCVEVNKRDYSGGWNVVDCAILQGFLCSRCPLGACSEVDTPL